MSSIFSTKSGTTEKQYRHRTRSSSVSTMRRVKDDNRIPAIQMKEERDVSTLVCMEISRAMLMDPGLDLRTFLRTAQDSRRDINISDATVIISVAVLEHIGNPTMANKLLSKSATLTRFYEKMGLKDKEVRKMMVTMLFALNPGFVEMIERSIEIVTQRSAALGREQMSGNQVVAAMSMLTLEGALTPTELNKSASFDKVRSPTLETESRRTSIQRTPAEMIMPNDSVSVVNYRMDRDLPITEADLMVYSNRRKSGDEPDFTSVFKRAKPPVAVSIVSKKNKEGLGWKNNSARITNSIESMDNILGSFKTRSVDHKTGKVKYRAPVVSDFLDSESISPSALRPASDVYSGYETKFESQNSRAPLPTEFTLPTTAYESSSDKEPSLSERDSMEEIRKMFGIV